MSLKKHILIFLLKFAVAYAIVLLPGCRDAYTDFYNKSGERLFGSFGEKGMVQFREKENKTDEDVQTVIYMMNKNEYARKQKSNTPVNARFIENNWLNDYLAVAFLIALIAATPIGWKRMLPAFGAGLLLIHLYLAFSLWIALRWQFHLYPDLDVVHLTGFGEKITGFLYKLLNKNPGTTVFASLTIWVLSVLRKSDGRLILH